MAGQGLSTFGTGRASSALGYGGLVLSAASESVGILVRALQDAGRLQILSRPQIMTMDNRPAQVQVGANVSRIGSSTATQFGQQVSVSEVSIGLRLQVWPRVNEDGLIVMQVQVERSSLGPEATGTPVGFGTNGNIIRSPIINTTNAQTTISAYSGQTVVFAGLIQKNRQSASRRVPYLADIPWLGALFRFDTETETRTELLVILTPRIVQTDEDYEVVKQVESSRMSYCLADILEMHGDVGLSGGHGLWGPARGPILYPDLQPSAVENLTPANTIMEMPYGTEIVPDPTVVPGAPGVPMNQFPSTQDGTVQPAPPLQPVSYERPAGSIYRNVPINRNAPATTYPQTQPRTQSGAQPATQTSYAPTPAAPLPAGQTSVVPAVNQVRTQAQVPTTVATSTSIADAATSADADATTGADQRCISIAAGHLSLTL